MTRLLLRLLRRALGISAAKQAAFEEQNRIKNQFRPLDEDEIGFLDNVRRAEREREEALRRETEEELSRFREARTKRERGPGEDKPETEAGIDEAAEQEEAGAAVEEWTVGGSASRKRKREREGKGLVIKGLKRTSRADHDDDDHQDGEDAKHHRKGAEEAVSPKRFETTAGGQAREAREAARTTEPQATVVKPRLGLVDYGSDDDDDNDE